MKLVVVLTAVVAVCGAAKLDRTYLPPASARTAGGSPGALQTPLGDSQGAFPKGSFTNDFQGVVVDAVAAGTRSSDPTDSGLGAPRHSYGSQDSKVGSAAFKLANNGAKIHGDDEEYVQGSADAFRTNTRFNAPSSVAADGQASATSFAGHGFPSQQSTGQERPQAAQDRSANTLRFDSEVGPEGFNYAFETDNGIAAEESAVATNGVQAQGAFSYTGDDGQVYSVTYTADEGGYQPKGDHLPTPPPIPEEILRSLEQNARDEAAGLIDDGSYDAKKYNEGSDYSETDNGQYKHGSSGQNNQGSFFGKQSAGHGSQSFASATSGQGNLGNHNGQDSSSDSSNVNNFSQGQSFASQSGAINGQTSQKQNRFSGSDLNSAASFQGNSQIGLQTGHGAQASAFASQGQNNNKQAFRQSSFGQTNNHDTDGTTGAGGNQFTSQFSQQSRFGTQATGNRQGQLNQYLPPQENKNQASLQKQTFSQGTFQDQVSHSNQVNQFNLNEQQENKFEQDKNFQQTQNAVSRFGGSVQGSQTNSQGFGSAKATGSLGGQHSGSFAFGAASFGSQLNNGRVSGFGGASNAPQRINGQSTKGQATLSPIGAQSHHGRQNGFGGVMKAHQEPHGQTGSSAFGSASFGAQSNNGGISSIGRAPNAFQRVNGQSSDVQKIGSSAFTASSFGAQSDIGHDSGLDSLPSTAQGINRQSTNNQQASSSAFGTNGAQFNNGHISDFVGAPQASQEINRQSSNSQQTGSSAFGAATFGVQSSKGRHSGVGGTSNQEATRQLSLNKLSSDTSFSRQPGIKDTSAHGSSSFGAASFGSQPNGESSRFGASNTRSRFGPAPESNGNSAETGKFNQGFLQQKQISGSQFSSQQSSGQFGRQKRPTFNQQAHITSGTSNENSYPYNQPTKQFDIPTNTQQSGFQSTTSQFNNQNAGPTQFGIVNQGTSGPLNTRPQTSAQSSTQFQSGQQSQGFQKQTSAIPQAFQPLRQPSSHSSASAQFSSSQAGSNEPVVSTQQYNGEIYEYNKPEQTLPSDKDQDGSSSSSQSTISSAFVGNNQSPGSSVAGKGEVFGGPRKAPSFDAKTGYHY